MLISTFECPRRLAISCKETIKSLERLLGEMRKIESRHAGRFYTPRTDVWDGLREPTVSE